MQTDVRNLRDTIIPKSDQLNAEQLLAGPMTITVAEVRRTASEDQPVTVHYEGEAGRPYKPCKTMRKVLVLAWGEDGHEWAGKSMTLYCDPSVRFGGETVGGIRISHVTDIPKDIHVALTATRGKKAKHVIQRLETDDARHMAAIREAATLDALQVAFVAATRSTKDAGRRLAFIAAKDARKTTLQQPAGKTLDQCIEAIDSASSADEAAEALADGIASLSADDARALQEAHDMAWKA